VFVHSVYFWLKPDLSDDNQQIFLEGLTSLCSIESVARGWVGKPADTQREVVDSSYSYALIVEFKDKDGHDAYQVDPVHDAFRDCSHCWEKVQIYDADDSL
jgi:hypothetical protein